MWSMREAHTDESKATDMLVRTHLRFLLTNGVTQLNKKQQTLEQARELIRSVWTDDLPQDIQDDLQKVYEELKWIAEDIE
jgi:hypothetical protein